MGGFNDFSLFFDVVSHVQVFEDAKRGLIENMKRDIE